MKEKDRKTRSDKKIRVNTTLPQDVYQKLKRLSIACDTKPTPLANDIIATVLNNPDWVNFFQRKYGATEFRIVPIMVKGKMIYSEYIGEG